MPTYLIPLAMAGALYLALPWLAVGFSRYCDVVNRLIRKRMTVKDGAVCRAYQTPTTPADSGVCARCGMYDYKHEE